METSDKLSPRQFLAAAFVSALSPLIRRFPRMLALHAGRGAALAVPAGALLLLPLLAAAYALYRRQAGRGNTALLRALLGRRAGRGAECLYGLWFLFYAGFLMRSGAERFITTVYNGAEPALFVCVMALLCALAAAGRSAPLGRAAMLLCPLMLGLILLIALLTAKDLDLTLLLPLSAAAPRGVFAGALETANILSVPFFLGFLGDRLTRPVRLREALPWLGACLGVIALMTVGCLGMFGPELTAKLRYPYFMLVRDLTVLGALERLEPLVIALWVFPDFLFVSLLLHLSARCLAPRLAARRWPAALCAGAAGAAALALPGEMGALAFLSETLVPRVCALFGFGLLPVLLLCAALRRGRE